MKNPSFVKKVMKTKEVNYLPYGSNDREFMKEIVTEAGYALQFGVNSIQDDKEIVLLAIQQCPWAYLYASDRLKQDPQVMMEAARHGCICGASQEIASNRKIVLNAVKVSAFNLMYVSEELRNDKEIVNAALCNDLGCFDNIGSELLKNREFCKKMVLQCGYKATRVIDESLMSDSTFLKELVDLRLDDLFELRVGSIVDRKFSKELIRMCPWFIRTMMFSKDEELVMEAAKCDPKTVQYAHDSLRNNSEFAMKLVELDARTLLHLGPEVKQCFRVVMQAVKQNGLCLPYASSDLKNDPHIVRAACQQNPQAIQYAGSMLKGSQEFMLEMIQHNLSALQHASIHLKRNCLFLQQVKQLVLSHQELMRVKNPNIDFSSLDELVSNLCSANLHYEFYCTHDIQLRQDRSLVMQCVKQNGLTLHNAVEELRQDRQVVLEAIKTTPKALQYAHYSLQDDKDLCLEAVTRDVSSFAYCSSRLKLDADLIRECVKQQGFTVLAQYLPSTNALGKTFAMELLEMNFKCIQFFPRDLTEDEEFMKEVFMREPRIHSLDSLVEC